MAWRRLPRLLLTLLLAASPRGLLADECPSSSMSSVRMSGSSYRNATGHWITQAAITHRSTGGVGDVGYEERPLQYGVDVTRQSCADYETLTTTFTVVAPPTRVGSDYKFFPSVGYYKLHTGKRSWEDARRACAEEGAHLAVVNSEAEENAIREVMRAYSKENYAAFIGFHDRFNEGEYLTIFGDPLDSSGRVRWASKEPNNMISPDSTEGEDCGNIFSDGTINDAKCSNKLAFVCEQSL